MVHFHFPSMLYYYMYMLNSGLKRKCHFYDLTMFSCHLFFKDGRTHRSHLAQAVEVAPKTKPGSVCITITERATPQ